MLTPVVVGAPGLSSLRDAPPLDPGAEPHPSADRAACDAHVEGSRVARGGGRGRCEEEIRAPRLRRKPPGPPARSPVRLAPGSGALRSEPLGEGSPRKWTSRVGSVSNDLLTKNRKAP